MVVKFARWAFEKFEGVEDKLGTQMRAVGEVMSIGKTYKEAFQKSIRSLEIGRYGLGFAKDFNQKSLDELMEILSDPTSERQFIMYEALRKGAACEDLYEKTYIKPWFIEQMKELVELEEKILKYKGQKTCLMNYFMQAKKDGFADRYLAQLLDIPEKEIREAADCSGNYCRPGNRCRSAAWKMPPIIIPPIMLRTSEESATGRKIMVLGAGPTVSARALSLIIAACMQPLPSAMKDMNQSWSTAIRKPFRPIMIPRINSILNRLPLRMF